MPYPLKFIFLGISCLHVVTNPTKIQNLFMPKSLRLRQLLMIVWSFTNNTKIIRSKNKNAILSVLIKKVWKLASTLYVYIAGLHTTPFNHQDSLRRIATSDRH